MRNIHSQLQPALLDRVVEGLMKKAICAVVLFLAIGVIDTQAFAQVNPLIPGTCGPSGCVSPAPQEAPHATGAAPAVIRTGDNSDQTKAPGSEQDAAKGREAETSRMAAAPVASQPPPPPSDFEKFVQSALGHPLPVFGRTLFHGATSGFTASASTPAPSDYVIGPGDEILIRAWGKIDVDAHVTVDRNGQIFLPRVGTLTVAGLRMDQLTEFIHGAIAQQFKDFELTVTLGQLRSIQVFVLGQAMRPGVYTISSLSTLVNALFASGGPSPTGTLRDIQVKRNGQVITHFDVYRLLLSGDKSADVHLLPGDIIYIPEIGPQVAIDGQVNTEAIFELRGDDTIASALRDAGGLTAVAGTARAVLERIVEHASRNVEEFSLDKGGMDRPLRDGDILRVFPISPKIENAVTLRGSVASPGLYSWHPGMRISDLIPNRLFLLTRSYYIGQNALDVPASGNPFGGGAVGATSAAGQNALSNNSLGAASGTATPDVANHDTEINWNYAVIQRLNNDDLTTRLIPFALGKAIADPSSQENKELQAGDVIVIYSRNDVSLPQELQAKFVRIDGQVNAPGTYRVHDGETLRELVEEAGGFAPHAYLYASQLTRESVRVEQIAEMQQLVDQESKEVLSPSNTGVTKLSGSTSSDASAELDLRRAYLARLAEIHPTGRIVLRLKPDANSVTDVPDFALEDGDHFFVPLLPNTIEVVGNVYNQGAMRYLPHQRFQQYLNAAGGATRVGDKKREFVIRADGTIVSRQQMSQLEKTVLYPGDSVVVPPKLKGQSLLDFAGYAQIISSLALGALAIKALQ